MTFLSLPSQCSNESVFAADFHPTDANVIVTCGKSHHYFWSLEKGSLVKKQGLFEVMCHKPLWSNSVNLFTFLLNQIACSDMVKCACTSCTLAVEGLDTSTHSLLLLFYTSKNNSTVIINLK